jgi:hypothetical protein
VLQPGFEPSASQNYWVFGPFPSPTILETRKHNVSETGCFFHPQVRGETPVPETSCFYFLEYWAVDKVQRLSNSECYTPSSEPFRIYHHLPIMNQEFSRYTSLLTIGCINHYFFGFGLMEVDMPTKNAKKKKTSYLLLCGLQTCPQERKQFMRSPCLCMCVFICDPLSISEAIHRFLRK